MKFNLKKDLCFFDIESTGLNVIRDRIVQIAVIKYFADGREPQELEMIINPGIPISEEAMAIHGITPADVANKPVFAQVAKKIFDFIGNSDLAGYNSNRFDVPLLVEEFYRVGFDFDIENRKLIDAQVIFYKMEPRNLKAALKFFCGTELENAHDALADVRATVDVLKGQIKKYENVDFIDNDGNVTENPVRNDMAILHAFTSNNKQLDITNRLKYNEKGEIVFNFGKYIGHPVAKIIQNDKNYLNWILKKDFSVQVKKIIRKIAIDLEK